MKVKEGFMLRRLGDRYVVVAVGDAGSTFHGMLRLNQTGAYLWEKLSAGSQTTEQLVAAVLDQYDIDRETARADTEEFLSIIRKAGILE